MDIDQLIEAKNKFKLAHKTFCWMGPEYRSKELHYLLGSIGSVKNITENTNKRVHYFVWPELSNETYNSDESYWGHESNMHTYTRYCDSEQNKSNSGFPRTYSRTNKSLSIDFTSHFSLAHLRYEIDRIKSSIVTIFYSQNIASLDEKTAFEISKKLPFLINHFPVMLRKKCLTKYNPLFLYLDKTLTNQNLKRDVIYENGSYFSFLDPDEKRILELIEAAIFSKKCNLPNLVKNLKKIQILNLDFSLMHDEKILDLIWLRYKSLLNEQDPLILAAHKKKVLDLVP